MQSIWFCLHPFSFNNLILSDIDWLPSQCMRYWIGQSRMLELTNRLCHLNIWLIELVLNSHLWHKYMCFLICLNLSDKDALGAQFHAYVNLCYSFWVSDVCELFYLIFFSFWYYTFISTQMLKKLKFSVVIIWRKKTKKFCYLLGDLLVIPFLVEFKIDPSRLKLDWRTIFIEFFGGNGGGDGSFNCSTGLCLPQRPIIIVKFVWFNNDIGWFCNLYGKKNETVNFDFHYLQRNIVIILQTWMWFELYDWNSFAKIRWNRIEAKISTTLLILF